MPRYKWERLPDRQPRGHPDNLRRVIQLTTADRAKLTPDGFYTGKLIPKKVKRGP